MDTLPEELTTPLSLLVKTGTRILSLKPQIIKRGITLKSNNPSGVQNAVFSQSSGFISTCQHPLIRSSEQKQFVLAKVSRVSSNSG